MRYPVGKLSVVRVGRGRGFVVQGSDDRFVITAAHCLPHFPPCASASFTEERTYWDLLGPLGGRATVWAECLFVDPIGDIAVLRSPDNQVLWNEAEKYESLTATVEALPVSDAPKHGPALLLSRAGRWFGCIAEHFGGPLWLRAAAQAIVGGMSGSPILANDGSAIGVLCTSSGSGRKHTEGGPNPRLSTCLPGWFLRDINLRVPRRATPIKRRRLQLPSCDRADARR